MNEPVGRDGWLDGRRPHPGRGRHPGAQQARRDRRVVVVAAVHRRAGVVRARRPADPGPQLRPRRARCSTSTLAPGRGRPRGCRARGRSRTRSRSGSTPFDEPRSGRRIERGAGRAGAVPRPAAGRRDAAEIEEVFAAGGAPLFPRSAATWTCTAAARTGRCRASTWPRCCYLLAEAFDDDPFLILAWRGPHPGAAARRAGRRPVAEPGAAGRATDVPFADRLADFYAPGAHRSPPRAPVRRRAPDLLPRVFPPPADLARSALTAAYRRLGPG